MNKYQLSVEDSDLFKAVAKNIKYSYEIAELLYDSPAGLYYSQLKQKLAISDEELRRSLGMMSLYAIVAFTRYETEEYYYLTQLGDTFAVYYEKGN